MPPKYPLATAGVSTGNAQTPRDMQSLRRFAAQSGVHPVDTTHHCARGANQQRRMNFTRFSDKFFSTPVPEVPKEKKPDEDASPKREAPSSHPKWNYSGRGGEAFNPVPFAAPDPEKPAEPGKYRVTNSKGLLVRGHARIASAEKGTILNGQEIRVVEVRGRRARVAGTGGVVAGWVSLRAANGNWLVERSDDLSPSPVPHRAFRSSASPAAAPAQSASPEPGSPGSPPQNDDVYDEEGYFGGYNPSPIPSPRKDNVGKAPPSAAPPPGAVLAVAPPDLPPSQPDAVPVAAVAAPQETPAPDPRP
eukprot:Hpha_TRINITY_DN7197_c0_g1::TRINITY_DN7197_c0_g1_i1::g.29756::m.29756